MAKSVTQDSACITHKYRQAWCHQVKRNVRSSLCWFSWKSQTLENIKCICLVPKFS